MMPGIASRSLASGSAGNHKNPHAGSWNDTGKNELMVVSRWIRV
jgi:hypothetical protein